MTPQFRFHIHKDLIQVVKKDRYLEVQFIETAGYGHHLSLVLECDKEDLQELKNQIEQLLEDSP